MTTTDPDPSWPELNQAFLVAEFAWLRQRLDPAGNSAPHQDGRTGRSHSGRASRMQPPPAIDLLYELFALTRFERQLLLLCAGVEMDSRLAEICAEAQGRPSRTTPRSGWRWRAFPTRIGARLPLRVPCAAFVCSRCKPGSNLTSAPSAHR